MTTAAGLPRWLDAVAALPLAVRDRVHAALPTPIRRALVAVFPNCGGRNHQSRFAGNLLRADLTDDDLRRIFHALILPNGVRKTSQHARNTHLLKARLESGDLVLAPRLRVLDVGSSLGVDALATAELLRTQGCEVAEYVLGDLHPRVLYDPERGLVFDEDGMLLQVRRERSFVAVHFSYGRAFHRVTHLPKRVLPWMLRCRYRYDPSAPLVSIPLVHPALRVDDPSSPFRLRRLDVFGPLGGQFDLVICMNLLLPQYFPPDTIESAIGNLRSHVAPGGTVIVGGADKLRVIRREDSAVNTRWRCASHGHCGCCASAVARTLPAPDADGARRCSWTAAT